GRAVPGRLGVVLDGEVGARIELKSHDDTILFAETAVIADRGPAIQRPKFHAVFDRQRTTAMAKAALDFLRRGAQSIRWLSFADGHPGLPRAGARGTLMI